MEKPYSKQAVTDAAARVQRLSKPGTPERFLTLQTVSDDTGIPAHEIVKAFPRRRRRKSPQISRATFSAWVMSLKIRNALVAALVLRQFTAKAKGELDALLTTLEPKA